MNQHSIGLEHEGYADQGGSWYNETLYRRSATLVAYLCKEYGIPIDHHHVIGHDQIPGTTAANVKTMHWDPGPFWDWERYFELMGAPLDHGTDKRRIKVGDCVRVLPGFEDNLQTTSVGTRPSNYVPVRQEPRPDAPPIHDAAFPPKPANEHVSDWMARAIAGTDFVVAEIKGDWTAIWFEGVKGWVHNPASRPVLFHLTKGRAVTPVGDVARTFGRCYPEAEAYPNPAWVQPVSPLQYTIPAGQAYVVTDTDIPGDYYRAKTYSLETPDDHIDIVGETKYHQISLGHRVAYVMADEVTIR